MSSLLAHLTAVEAHHLAGSRWVPKLHPYLLSLSAKPGFCRNSRLNESFPPISMIDTRNGIISDCPLSPYLFIIVLEVLARAIRQQKEIKIGKEETKL